MSLDCGRNTQRTGKLCTERPPRPGIEPTTSPRCEATVLATTLLNSQQDSNQSKPTPAVLLIALPYLINNDFTLIRDPQIRGWLVLGLRGPRWSAQFLLFNPFMQNTTQSTERNLGVGRNCRRCNQQTGRQSIANTPKIVLLHAVILHCEWWI